MMLTYNRTLAVLLREAQWELDDVAFELPTGRCTPGRRAQLADVLVELANALRRPLSGDAATDVASTPHGTVSAPRDGRCVDGGLAQSPWAIPLTYEEKGKR